MDPPVRPAHAVLVARGTPPATGRFRRSFWYFARAASGGLVDHAAADRIECRRWYLRGCLVTSTHTVCGGDLVYRQPGRPSAGSRRGEGGSWQNDYRADRRSWRV